MNIFETYRVGININNSNLGSAYDGRYSIYGWGYEVNGSMSGTNYSGLHSEPVKLPFTVDDFYMTQANGILYKQGNDLYVLGGNSKTGLGLGENASDYADVFTPIKCYSGTNIQKFERNSVAQCFILDNGILLGSSADNANCYNDGQLQPHPNWDIIDTDVTDFTSSNTKLLYIKNNKLYYTGFMMIRNSNTGQYIIPESYNSSVLLEDCSDVDIIRINTTLDYILVVTKDKQNTYVWGENKLNRFTSSSTSTIYKGDKISLYTYPVKSIPYQSVYNRFISYLTEDNKLYGRGDFGDIFPTTTSWSLLKDNCTFADFYDDFYSFISNNEGIIKTTEFYKTQLNLPSTETTIFPSTLVGEKQIKKMYFSQHYVSPGNFAPVSFCLVDEKGE